MKNDGSSFTASASLVTSKTATGFPSPATDNMEVPLDLNNLLIVHPAATFFMRVNGNTMREDGLQHNDLLIVDRARKPALQQVVVTISSGELIVTRFKPDSGEIADSIEIWGTVTHVIRKL